MSGNKFSQRMTAQTIVLNALRVYLNRESLVAREIKRESVVIAGKPTLYYIISLGGRFTKTAWIVTAEGLQVWEPKDFWEMVRQKNEP